MIWRPKIETRAAAMRERRNPKPKPAREPAVYVYKRGPHRAFRRDPIFLEPEDLLLLGVPLLDVALD